jgi:uncharacterized protein
MIHLSKRILTVLLSILMMVCSVATVSARGDDDFPAKPNPPRLVNDFAGMIGTDHIQDLENKLVEYANSSSTQISIVTIQSLGDYDVSDYAIKLFNKWGIGQAGKNNGVLILASRDDRKIWIVSGKGLEGVLTDQKTGQIYRNEMVPSFKEGNYYAGFSKAADAIIAVTKGEYKGEPKHAGKKGQGIGTIIFIIIIIIIAISRGGGGSGGGKYMSRGGAGDIASAILWGSLLGGGRSSGGGSSWGGGGGGGGFGGFGGGSSGGGGAGGSW